MKACIWLVGFCFLWLSSLASAGVLEQSMVVRQFGKISIYGDPQTAKRVMLFLSGDGGWNLGVVDMARTLAQDGNLVIGLDIRKIFKDMNSSKDKCSYPAADFEGISIAVQQKYKMKKYYPPIVIGYSSGATLAYAALAQAPGNTFAGAVSLGFCPDLEVLKIPCAGRGLRVTAIPKKKYFMLAPDSTLEKPWIVLHGEKDDVCSHATAQEFVGKTKNASLVSLPKVGHGFSVTKNWMPQFRDAVRNNFSENIETPKISSLDTTKPTKDVSDLPLVETLSQKSEDPTLVVFLSGDGGWAALDRGVSEQLAQQGKSIVGFNMLQYLWYKKTPEIAAQDLARVIAYYSTKLNKSKVLLVGYSAGADIVGFMANRLPEDMSKNIIGVVLLAPSPKASFEFHVSDWIAGESSPESVPVLPEIETLFKHKIKVLCLSGKEETDSLCTEVPANIAVKEVIDGSHHFGGNYGKLTNLINQYFFPFVTKAE